MFKLIYILQTFYKYFFDELCVFEEVKAGFGPTFHCIQIPFDQLLMEQLIEAARIDAENVQKYLCHLVFAIEELVDDCLFETNFQPVCKSQFFRYSFEQEEAIFKAIRRFIHELK